MPQESLTGYRKYKSPFVAEINARKQYLPALYSQKREDKYRDQQFGLQEEGLAQNREFSLKNLELAKDAAHQARKRDKLAKNLGYAGLGLQAGFGAANSFDFSNLFSGDEAANVVSDFSSDIPGELIKAPIEEAFSGGTDVIRDFAGFGGDSIFGALVGSAIDFF